MLTAARKKFRRDQSRAFHEQSVVCQVGRYVQGLPIEKCLGPHQLHHILGRSSAVLESDWFCNFIYVSPSMHALCEGKHSANMLVACLKAKLEAHRWLVLTDGYMNDRPERLHWNPAAMDRLCYGGGLSGWIDGKLRPSLTGVFVSYADEIINELQS